MDIFDERYNQIIDEAYEKWIDENWNKRIYPNINGKEEFINKIKTNIEFSEKWGLKIEERELSLEERNDYYTSNYKGLDCESHEELNKLGDIPTKLITATYQENKTEVYE